MFGEAVGGNVVVGLPVGDSVGLTVKKEKVW